MPGKLPEEELPKDIKKEDLEEIVETLKNIPNDKTEIKNAVEKVFGVKVASVNTMNMLGKNKRMGVHVGKKADWKKAIVTLTEESKTIEFFEGI